MTTVFGKEYAGNYDLFYQDKDYDAECDLIERIISEYASGPVHSILDLGCGTGNHALRLSERGYTVHGVDRSGEMLEIARRKAHGKGLSCTFSQSDLREFQTNETFDVVIMMFAVLGYNLENDDVIAALHTVRAHLNPGGLFICDVWYGPAVLDQKPGDRVRVIEEGRRKIIRASSGELDRYHHRVKVRFHVWEIIGDRVVSETEEEHAMRFFFAQELKLLFDYVGLTLSLIYPFPNLDKKSKEEWNIGIIAKKAD